jgi:protein transport protein SEC13
MFCFIVNTVAWAPYEYGLMLACGSSDGSISIISSTGRNEVLIDCWNKSLCLGDGRWTTKKIPDCHPVWELYF